MRFQNIILRHLSELNTRQREIIDEILIEPYGTTRYEILRLHLAILDLKITLIKEIFKIK